MKEVHRQRARYVERVPLWDRVNTACTELFGEVDDDPPLTIK
jgi:hypothetical protein